MASRYWVVSLPVQSSTSSLWSRLQEAISKHSFDTPLYRFNIPDLRVGTLDSLLSLSDDLLKSNSFVEGVSHKIRRQIEELERVSGVESSALTVDGVPVDSYLTRFVWDEAKYPTMSPLREIVDSIHVQVAKIEDDLKPNLIEAWEELQDIQTLACEQKDRIIWRPDSRGLFSISSAWELIRPQHIGVSWHHITWSAGHIPRHAFILWMAIREALLTRDKLTRWGTVGNDICLLCNSASESHDHLFSQCPYAEFVWRSLSDLCQICVISFASWHAMVHCTLLRSIIADLAGKFDGLPKEVRDNARNRRMSEIWHLKLSWESTRIHWVSWIPLDHGNIKMNTDGAVAKSYVGYGCIFRRLGSKVMHALAGKRATGSVLEMELLAVRRGLEVAYEMGYMRIQIDSDSLWGVKCIQNAYPRPGKLWGPLNEIEKLRASMEVAEIRHIFRKGNRAVDALAKTISSLKLSFFCLVLYIEILIIEIILLLSHSSQVRVAEYSNVRSQLNAINRKQSGSLAVRDLSDLVKPEDIIMSEHLVTLLAVIPKYSQKDWLSSYETLTTYVVRILMVVLTDCYTAAELTFTQVPRSSKKLHEDNEYALYTVTLFLRVADNFKTSARERGFQIRDFEYSPEAQETRIQELERLMQDQETLRSSLLQWCYTSYGEVFSSWMHFCAVRVFTESILRYGLPPSFLAAVLAPSLKSEKKVHSILEGLCDTRNSAYWKSEDEIGGMAGLGVDVDAHPYVFFMINLI
ncbi:hypothetical protein HHK36_015917 [Tetracentron sinense]|uniref:V-type proton ATPase subunit C n=1 Tax=Tetracentron sinense TaxID=13715 RepID=A0A834ZDD4_TETSI|nr:hypothetical protein HHK36_015917 [Tetracentron sinense]